VDVIRAIWCSGLTDRLTLKEVKNAMHNIQLSVRTTMMTPEFAVSRCCIHSTLGRKEFPEESTPPQKKNFCSHRPVVINEMQKLATPVRLQQKSFSFSVKSPETNRGPD